MAAGYSSTPLARKLGIKDGHRLVLIGAPDGWQIDHLPPGVSTSTHLDPGRADIVIGFSRRLADLQAGLNDLAAGIVADGALWLAWPRRAGGHNSDITDNNVRQATLPLGLVDTKVAALDEDWSGLKFVWRKEMRAGLAAPPES